MNTFLANNLGSRVWYEYLEEMAKALRQGNVLGIQEKIRSTGKNFAKFWSIISELKVARILCENGKKVTILPDPTTGKTFPDIVSKDGTFGSVYIEVKLSVALSWLGIIQEELDDFLKRKSFQVNVDLSEFLAEPTFEGKEMTAQEAAIREECSEFRSRVNISNPVPVATKNMVFYLMRVEDENGYVGIVGSLKSTRQDKIKSRMIKDILFKASKRDSWKKGHLDVPYIIALDLETTVRPNMIRQVLFGYNDYYSQNDPDVSTLPLVQRALERGWKSYLENQGIVHNNKNQFYAPIKNAVVGLLYKRELQNVSGLLFSTPIEKYYVPNPFCEDAINDPKFASYLVNGVVLNLL